MSAASIIRKLKADLYIKILLVPSTGRKMNYAGLVVPGLMFLLTSLPLATPLLLWLLYDEWSQQVLSLAKAWLELEYEAGVLTEAAIDNLTSFLDGFSHNMDTTVLVLVLAGVANILLDCVMLIGSCYHSRCQ